MEKKVMTLKWFFFKNVHLIFAYNYNNIFIVGCHLQPLYMMNYHFETTRPHISRQFNTKEHTLYKPLPPLGVFLLANNLKNKELNNGRIFQLIHFNETHTTRRMKNIIYHNSQLNVTCKQVRYLPTSKTLLPLG